MSYGLRRRLTTFALFICCVTPLMANAEQAPSESHRRWTIIESHFPTLRLAFGAGLLPDTDDEARVLLDLHIGGQLAFWHRGTFNIEFVPEMGYAFFGNGDELAGHYGVGAIGIRFAWHYFGVATTTALLLGKRDNEFDLGLRNGLRLDTLFGIIGFEVSHEWRTGDAGETHAIRFQLALTLSPRAIRQAREDLGMR